MEDSSSPHTLLFYRILVGVKIGSSLSSLSFSLQILTLNLLSPKSPILHTAEFKYKLLTTEGLLGEQIFLQDVFAMRQLKMI